MNNPIFIKKIQVNNVRHINNHQISIDDSKRKHLIFTGKNGSGKTTLLRAINTFLSQVVSGSYQHYERNKKHHENVLHRINILKNKEHHEIDSEYIQLKSELETWKNHFSQFGGLELEFSNLLISERATNGEFVIAFFNSKRSTSLNTPSGINKIDLQKIYRPMDKAHTVFLQYIVNLKAERSFARDDGDNDEVERIDKWFFKIEKRLQDIFEEPELSLSFDRKNYSFLLETPTKSYSFEEMSDGQSAIFNIITELLMRMESKNNTAYDMEGIVLIDEIETHLHVSLQKKILPFLSDFFPNIQFIVTTHSPFVLSSISESVIFDLETLEVTEDLSGYSYDTLIESYFLTDKYSEVLSAKIKRLEELSHSTASENKLEFHSLKNELSNLPKYLGTELQVKLQQIELSLLNRNGE